MCAEFIPIGGNRPKLELLIALVICNFSHKDWFQC